MVNSVQRLRELKAFVHVPADLRKYGGYGDGTGTNGDVARMLEGMPEFARTKGRSSICRLELPGRTKQRDYYSDRRHGEACFPMRIDYD
jgi:hypothetical protein